MKPSNTTNKERACDCHCHYTEKGYDHITTKNGHACSVIECPHCSPKEEKKCNDPQCYLVNEDHTTDNPMCDNFTPVDKCHGEFWHIEGCSHNVPSKKKKKMSTKESVAVNNGVNSEDNKEIQVTMTHEVAKTLGFRHSEDNKEWADRFDKTFHHIDIALENAQSKSVHAFFSEDISIKSFIASVVDEVLKDIENDFMDVVCDPKITSYSDFVRVLRKNIIQIRRKYLSTKE